MSLSKRRCKKISPRKKHALFEKEELGQFLGEDWELMGYLAAKEWRALELTFVVRGRVMANRRPSNEEMAKLRAWLRCTKNRQVVTSYHFPKTEQSEAMIKRCNTAKSVFEGTLLQQTRTNRVCSAVHRLCQIQRRCLATTAGGRS